MSSNTTVDPSKNAPEAIDERLQNVLPRTLGIRPLKAGVDTVHGVYGGNSGTVWVATFADEGEAQTWIMASNHFGQPVNGYEMPELPKVLVEGTPTKPRPALLYTTREYPCGCRAQGCGDVPNYCGDHDGERKPS